ncbi:MAG: RNA-binding transcriptional accessory protein [Rubrivivax sp.]|nr:RNA-binding transcriptional accessory protein [Rubrivivax sp.]
MNKILLQIAAELKVRPAQVNAAVELLDGGSTVPFIARYRKEATDGLDDIQLRELETRLAYLRELEDRRAAVLKSIEEQGKLTPELRAAIEAAPTKQELEDLYLPYKPRRRTKGMIAREAGIEPLADRLFADPTLDPSAEAAAFVAGYPGGAAAMAEAGFADAYAVLDGVRDLMSERWAEDAALVGKLREWLWAEGLFKSQLADGKDGTHTDAAKFRDYFDYAEPIRTVPSHRALAVFRGRSQEWLDAKLVLDEPAPTVTSAAATASAAAAGVPRPPVSRTAPTSISLAEGRIARHLGWSWKVKLSLSLERDLFARLREDAEAVAIQVFGDNVRDLLLAAPAGKRVVMGLDPGIRTGVKVAVVSDTGKVLDTATVYPHEPRNDWEGALHALGRLVAMHGVNLIAIGNGTASRETDKLAAELIQRIRRLAPEARLDKVVVSEAGASVYSASEYASKELPELDVSLRGAVSIARRLQDPLAELVKIDPKSIGVGQYQHDVNQSALVRTLDAVVEDCVNAVGVDLNTASVPLLSRVSGLSASVAGSIVRWRDTNGAFRSRQQLLDVAGLGPRTFEQAAGFLRIRDGDNPLDMTGVHPETYPVVQKMLERTGKGVQALMGQADVLRALKPEAFADERFGAITVKDILTELEKPGRDPRPDFQVARFNDSVSDLKDLQPGMLLEGTVSNVAQFGAFVDLGVHQDGLIHVSQLSHKFVNDAREVVKTGQVVKVKVLEVDLARKRISLTMKLDAAVTPRGATRSGDNSFRPAARQERPGPRGGAAGVAEGQGAMAAAFAKLQGRR